MNYCTIWGSPCQILTWLSPLESRLYYKDIQDQPVENLGEWLLQTEFRSWCGSSEEVSPMSSFVFFAMEIRGSVTHIFGNGANLPESMENSES